MRCWASILVLIFAFLIRSSLAQPTQSIMLSGPAVVPPQTIASVNLSNNTYTSNTANAVVGNVSATMLPPVPVFSGAFTLNPVNGGAGGFHLVGVGCATGGACVLQANSAGTTGLGPFNDLTIVATETGMVPVSVTPTLTGSAIGPTFINFTHLTIDPNPPSGGSYGSGITVADIDGDGRVDVFTADGPSFGTGTPVVSWYRNPGVDNQGNWTRVTINGNFGGTDHVNTVMHSAAGSLVAIDSPNSNGIPSFITSDWGAGQIVWYENPRHTGGNPSTAAWPVHLIGNAYDHDRAVADINGDGKVDIITHGHFGITAPGPPEQFILWLQGADPNTWTQINLVNAPDYNTTSSVKGVAVGNLAGHVGGLLDIVGPGYWLEQPADPTNGAAWTAHVFDASAPLMSTLEVADMNGDGRLDVVMNNSDGVFGPLVWYENGPGDPRNASNWTKHVINNSVASSHKICIVDINNDGHPDIIWGEISNGGSHLDARVGIEYNNGTGTAWVEQLISTTRGGRPLVADFGNDGDLDIVSTLDDKDVIDGWFNQSSTSGSPNLSRCVGP